MSSLLDTAAVATRCGVSKPTARKWLESGKLPCILLPSSGKRRKLRRVDPSALEAFIKANTIEVKP